MTYLASSPRSSSSNAESLSAIYRSFVSSPANLEWRSRTSHLAYLYLLLLTQASLCTASTGSNTPLSGLDFYPYSTNDLYNWSESVCISGCPLEVDDFHLSDGCSPLGVFSQSHLHG